MVNEEKRTSGKNGSLDPASEFYIHRKEFEELKHEVTDMARSVSHLVTTIDTHLTKLVDTLSGQSPDKCVPLETHKMVVKGLVVAFTIIVLATVGSVKLIPAVIGAPIITGGE
jgi:hypothetical protein